MNSPSDKQALLEKIRDTIRDLVEESITFQEAKETYEDLRREAESIGHDENVSSESDSGHVQSLMRNHNVSNFCKLTAEFSISGNDLDVENFSGSESLLPLLKDTIIREKGHINEQSSFALPAFLLDGLEYRAYIRKCITGEKYIVAVSSSKYSRMEVFDRFTSILNSLYGLQNRGNTVTGPGIYDKIRTETVELLKQHINAGVGIKCMLYRFDNIYEIFEHRGLKTLLDIDQRIVMSLQNYHGYEGTVTALGPSTYLVLLPVEQRSEDKKSKPPARLLFEYEDVIFRYWVYRTIIQNETEAESVFYWISETLKEANG